MRYQAAVLAILATAPAALADFEIYYGQWTDLSDAETGTNYQAWFFTSDPDCDAGESNTLWGNPIPLSRPLHCRQS